MTKEKLSEELLTKRSAASDINGDQPTWHEASGLDVEQLKISE